VKEWLTTQSTYKTHEPIHRKFKTRQTFVQDLNDQLQMDLVDMRKFARHNKDHYWILTAVEIPIHSTTN
jgi:hypothetical protein